MTVQSVVRNQLIIPFQIDLHTEVLKNLPVPSWGNPLHLCSASSWNVLGGPAHNKCSTQRYSKG
jgi:hypothetical protein